MKKIIVLTLLAGSILMAGCASKKNLQTAASDTDSPVDITIWHYYNGTQKATFDELVSEFNDTLGREKGIYVEGHSKGNVAELESAVRSSGRKEVGSEDMPNIFSSYADTAFEIEKAGLLVDLSLYFTPQEQSEYVDSYIDEGRIGSEGQFNILPVAKSTEVLMVNKTVWDELAEATGVTVDDLKTNKKIAETAEKYYNWTDAKTPNIPHDGKAFYGRDAMANLFIISSMQQGVELFRVEDHKVTLNADREVFKDIWDTFYTPYIKGYFGAYGRFRSDDLKIGKVIAYTGSIASASYFPDHTEVEEIITPIECLVLPAPLTEGGDAYIIQQGAGMVVTKSTPQEEAAAVTFLKWFTQTDKNTEFGCTSGYVPVKKEAGQKEILESVIRNRNIDISQKEYDTLITAYNMVNTSKCYAGKAFSGGSAARKILEFDLKDKAEADRQKVTASLTGGMTLDEAVEDLISDDAFEAWFHVIIGELESAIALGAQDNSK